MPNTMDVNQWFYILVGGHVQLTKYVKIVA